jgi:hypothetical protein
MKPSDVKFVKETIGDEDDLAFNSEADSYQDTTDRVMSPVKLFFEMTAKTEEEL